MCRGCFLFRRRIRVELVGRGTSIPGLVYQDLLHGFWGNTRVGLLSSFLGGLNGTLLPQLAGVL